MDEFQIRGQKLDFCVFLLVSVLFLNINEKNHPFGATTNSNKRKIPESRKYYIFWYKFGKFRFRLARFGKYYELIFSKYSRPQGEGGRGREGGVRPGTSPFDICKYQYQESIFHQNFNKK